MSDTRSVLLQLLASEVESYSQLGSGCSSMFYFIGDTGRDRAAIYAAKLAGKTMTDLTDEDLIAEVLVDLCSGDFGTSRRLRSMVANVLALHAKLDYTETLSRTNELLSGTVDPYKSAPEIRNDEQAMTEAKIMLLCETYRREFKARLELRNTGSGIEVGSDVETLTELGREGDPDALIHETIKMGKSVL